MNALRHILAPTDMSAPARLASERAARLAREHGARLTLLQVLPPGPLDELRQWLGSGTGSALAQALLADARRELDELALQLQAEGPVAIDTRTECAAVLASVQQAGEAVDADLVVLGARGAGVLRRLMLGTTAERLLRRTTRPLLVVRQPAQGPYRRALLALDFSPWSAAVLAAARKVAPKARWVLCTAYQVPFEDKLRFAGVDESAFALYRQQARQQATQQLHALAAGAGLQPGQWDAALVEGDAAVRLLDEERARDCDLVVLGKHGQSAAEDLLLGSVTKHVLAEGTADVLMATRPAAGRIPID